MNVREQPHEGTGRGATLEPRVGAERFGKRHRAVLALLVALGALNEEAPIAAMMPGARGVRWLHELLEAGLVGREPEHRRPVRSLGSELAAEIERDDAFDAVLADAHATAAGAPSRALGNGELTADRDLGWFLSAERDPPGRRP